MSVTDQRKTEFRDEAGLDAPKAKRKSILQFEVTAKKVPRKELMHFSRQLAVFIRAGIPIIDALETITEDMSNKHFKGILQQMVEDLRSGSTFADAAAVHEKTFPTYYLGILRSAELTGRLDTVLEQLSEYLERDVEARGKITSALVYPMVVAVMSAVTVVVLTAFVLPRFEKFFESLHATLPLPTRILLNSSRLLSNYWYVPSGLLLLTVLAVVLGVRTESGRHLKDRLLLKIPVVGDLVQHAVLERFCRILASMASAGVPLPEALEVTSQATNNVVYQRGIGEARAAMVRGEGLAAPLAATGLFPGAARQMFRVGESTGTLDEQLAVAADYYDRELDHKIKRFTNLFEPAVLLAMGLVVGFVAIALVSAMYGIFNQVNTV